METLETDSEETLSLATSSDDDETPFVTPQKRRYRRSLFLRNPKNRPKRHKTINAHNSVGNIRCQTLTDSYQDHEDQTVGDFEKDNEDASSLEFRSADEESLSLSEHENSSSISEESDFLEISSDEELREFLSSECDSGEENENHTKKHGETCENEHIYNGAKLSIMESSVSIMLFVMKHSLSKDAFSDLLLLIRAHLPRSESHKFPTSVYKLKDFLKRNTGFKDPQSHHLCESCGSFLQNGKSCEKEVCMNAKTIEFFDLRLENQLQKLLKDKQFCKLTIEKDYTKDSDSACTDETELSDISDGMVYRQMTKKDAKAADHVPEKTLTFTMNTDGVALFNSSKKGSLWPVYLAVNELPVKLRYSKKYLITTNLYCHTQKPNMITYLMPLMDKLKMLQTEGLKIQTALGEVLLKCRLLAVSLDLPAKAMVLNMKQFNGKHGCTYCMIEGSTGNSSLHRYFPFEDIVQRTHKSLVEDAQKALAKGDAIHGIKGANVLMKLRQADIPNMVVIDWMHSVLLGTVKTLLSMWCGAAFKGRKFYVGDKMALINQRILAIQVPDFISRQQRNLEDYKHWKASECKEWLLHFSVPVMAGIQHSEILIHYGLLVTAMFLLNQEKVSRPCIQFANECLQDFCQLFSTYYDAERQTMNIHLLRHMAHFVTLYGPLFHYSCFGFESMNHHLKKMVHGTRFINDQICLAVGMTQNLSVIVKSLALKSACEDTKDLIQHLSKNLTSDDVPVDRQPEPLGKGKDYTLSQKEQENFPDIPRKVVKFDRVRASAGTIFSQGYCRQIKKNSYTVLYLDSTASKCYGCVKRFFFINNGLFAIIDQFRTTALSLLNFTGVDNRLKKYKDKNICPQLVELHCIQTEQLCVVPVCKIIKKCVVITCQGNKTVLSIPPNLLEHS